MSLTVTQRPSQTISGETSRWNAIAHPLLYKMQRKDFTFASITNSGGFVRLVLDASFGNVASSFDVDDVVYFQTDAGVYAVNGIVTASSYSAPNTLVDLGATAYISSSTGFVNNETLRPLYGVDVSVYDAANVLLNADPFRFSPSSKGALVIDIQSILRAYLSPDNNADLTGTTEIFDDSGVYKKFYIKYTEVWTASAESETNDSSNQFFATLSALQIPATYGSNMGQYVTFEDGGPVAKFLTRLDTPRMWRGYPFLLSAIVGDNVSSNVFLDITDTTTPAAYTGKVLNFDLNQIITDQTVESDEARLYKDAAPDVLLTEAKTITLHDACANPIMLMGRNSLGGVMQWLFEGSQDEEVDYGNDTKAKKQVLFAENITKNEWDALQDFITLGEVYRNNITEFTSSTIKTSSRIGQQLYVVNADGTKIGVIATKTNNKTRTENARHTFEIEIEYPETFAP